MTAVVRTERSRRRCRRRYTAAPDLEGGQAVAKIAEQSCWALPKNLIRPLPVQDLEFGGSGDLLSRSSVHAGARDGEDYGGGAVAREEAKP